MTDSPRAGKRYQLLYADPPWAYRSRAGGSWKSHSSAHYPTLSIEQLALLDVPSVAADNAVLALWIPVPLLPQAFPVAQAWGFDYKTCMVWNKTGRWGLGWWFRNSEEFLTIHVRGKVRPPRLQRRNEITAPVGRHSAKPEEFRLVLDQLAANCFGLFPAKIELFARGRTAGWDAHGLEAEGGREIPFRERKE